MARRRRPLGGLDEPPTHTCLGSREPAVRPRDLAMGRVGGDDAPQVRPLIPGSTPERRCYSKFVITASPVTDKLSTIALWIAAFGALLTFGVAVLSMWINMSDRRRALIDALGAWFEGNDVREPSQILKGKLHIKNEAPTPMRGVCVLLESFTPSDDGFFARPDDRISYPLFLGTVAPKAHLIKDIGLKPDPDNPVSSQTIIYLRVKDVVARDNTGRIWLVNKSLERKTRARLIKTPSDIIQNWPKRFDNYKTPIKEPAARFYDPVFESSFRGERLLRDQSE